MTTFSIKSFAVASCVTLLPALASASTVSSVEVISVQRNFSGGPVTVVQDNQTVNNGTASASLAFGNVEAVQNADGTSTVQAHSTFNANSEVNSAVASFTQAETNTFGMDRDYTLDFSLSGMTARLFHNFDGFFGPGSNVNPFANDLTQFVESNYTAASFQYSILVNGAEVFNARADAVESDLGVSVENVSNFTTSVVENAFDTVFSVADISGTIGLGTFSAGETITVESILTARSYSTGLFDEIGNSVGSFSSDPVSLSSTGFLTSTPTNPTTSPVPLPAAGWMLIAGIGGLAAAGKRKKRA